MSQSITSFERHLNQSSNIILAPHRYRSPYEPGVGVFEHIGGDLALIKPGLELTENDRMREIKELCTKIYRSTNMRY